ncbi:TonB-dependent receptor [Neisseria weixii]|uniref:TonB-dependent receptor n=1 Tax=Neisseria weixii TaxID=1853276 RepID=A0A3N4MSS5_9NEIS|nr:TonB-dependent receptor [Neisseria weixii]RPD87636.1 TonB-dependent receptor [Neisseria weixii]
MRIGLRRTPFDIEQKNLTVYTPSTYEKTQRGKVRTCGAETEIQGDITPAWGISGNYTYLDKKVREDSDASAVGTTSWGTVSHCRRITAFPVY